VIAALLALGSCSSETATSDHGIYGAWGGQTSRKGTRYSFGGTSWAESVPATAWKWNLQACPGGAMMEVALGCWLPLTSKADGTLSFTPEAWCNSTSAGKTIRILAKGGSISIMTATGVVTLQGELLSEIEMLPGDGTYNLDTWTPMASEHYAELKQACPQAHYGPVPQVDHSAQAKCAEIVDRHFQANDRTIALSASGFDPACMQIAPGQSVTFTGVFSKQSLQPGVFGNLAAGAAANPLGLKLAGTTAQVTYPRPGDYLFHSPATGHPVGLIRVR
jgi:plastocyanin